LNFTFILNVTFITNKNYALMKKYMNKKWGDHSMNDQ